jgi:hypothetical protein
MFPSVKTGAGIAQSVQCLTTDWPTGLRSLAAAKDFSSSLCVQTGSEAHPASYPIGKAPLSNEYRESLPGVKRGRGVTLITHPSSAEVKNE